MFFFEKNFVQTNLGPSTSHIKLVYVLYYFNLNIWCFSSKPIFFFLWNWIKKRRSSISSSSPLSSSFRFLFLSLSLSLFLYPLFLRFLRFTTFTWQAKQTCKIRLNDDLLKISRLLLIIQFLLNTSFGFFWFFVFTANVFCFWA